MYLQKYLRGATLIHGFAHALYGRKHALRN